MYISSCTFVHVPCNPVTSAVALPLLSNVTRLTSTSSSGIAVKRKSSMSLSVESAGSDDRFRRTVFENLSPSSVII